MGDDRYWHHHGGHPFAWILLLLFLIGVAAVVVILVRMLIAGRAGPVAVAAPARADDALATVRMRYARGEIGRDELLRLSEDLGGPPATTAAIPPPG